MNNKYLIKITYQDGSFERSIANNYKLTPYYFTYDYYNDGICNNIIDLLKVTKIEVFEDNLLKALFYI